MTHRSFTIAGAVAALVGCAVGPAWARNPHCAGGIQYVVQATAEKQKQSYDEASRLMLKAVQQLEMCATEDPKDFEAIGYLGWAYAEVDSACLAGKAFQTAIDGLTTKGDKKKLELVLNNRESFWATKFNDGIAKINTGQEQYSNFTAKPANAAEETSKAAARASYDAALKSLNQALCLKPGDARTLKNVATVYAYTGDYAQAQHYIDEGLRIAPNDSTLKQMKHGMGRNSAATLVEEKKYDEAVAQYGALIKADPNNPDLYAGLADAQFSRAKDLKDAERKAAFKASGDAYAKAASMQKEKADLPFNAGLAYQNAGEWALAEAQWKLAIAAQPKPDPEAYLAYAQTLAELKKFGEAVTAAERALAIDTKEKNNHRLLSAMYSKAGNNERSRQEAMVFLALDKGTKGTAPGAPSGAAGQKVKAASGDPEELILWDAEGQKYESWFYWSKGQAYHFSNGVQIGKSDWSSVLAQK